LLASLDEYGVFYGGVTRNYLYIEIFMNKIIYFMIKL